MSVSYVLDADDIITCVCGNWDQLSVGSGGPANVAERVIGTPLWEHMADPATVSYHNAVFFSVRRLFRPVQLSYRCDAPDRPVAMRMTITPSTDGSLELRHDPVPAPALPASSTRLLRDRCQTAMRCSICCKHSVDNAWIDRFHHPFSRIETSAYTVCPQCKSHAIEALSGINTQMERAFS